MGQRERKYDSEQNFLRRPQWRSSVRAQDIFDACSKVLQTGLNNLVIYFSGHGYAIPGHEVWLLPSWNENSNEAINVSASMLIARRYEKPNISFIADACRVALRMFRRELLGMVILPRSPIPSSAARVDEFFATRFGDPSQQYQESALRASYDFQQAADEGAERRQRSIVRTTYVVVSRSLQDHLRRVFLAPALRSRAL